MFANNARFERGILIHPPLLCVEILSPGQTMGMLYDKAEAYYQAGVAECWVIWPQKGRIARTSADGRISSEAELTFGEVVIRCADLFDNLPPDAI